MTVSRTSDEVAHLGGAIYERDIRHQVETGHHGEIVAIDVDSGCWGISADLLDARAKLDQQLAEVDPDNVWFVRVGFATLRNFGGRPRSPAT